MDQNLISNPCPWMRQNLKAILAVEEVVVGVVDGVEEGMAVAVEVALGGEEGMVVAAVVGVAVVVGLVVAEVDVEHLIISQTLLLLAQEGRLLLMMRINEVGGSN